jgi:cytochrome c oxidase assembly protein subunit 15
MLHRFARLVVVCTLFLILAGSLVTSTNSGLAVPDWPTTYGWNMFTFPPAMWVGGIFYEHGHRLIASGVGFLTIVLAIWLWKVESRGWMKRLGAIALGTVILQGLLGGITVLYLLPAAVSTAHAGLAEIFFCLTVSVALFTSPGWIRGNSSVDDVWLRRTASATTALVFIQILIGAAMRHTGAGLAIPDFPLMFGGLIPDRWSPGIAIHFAHRAGALIVGAAVLVTAAHVYYHHRDRMEFVRPARLLMVLIVVQITLGALTILSRRDVWINSAHVVCGALVLAISLVLTLRSWRPFLASEITTSTVRDDRTSPEVRATARRSPVAHGEVRA